MKKSNLLMATAAIGALLASITNAYAVPASSTPGCIISGNGEYWIVPDLDRRACFEYCVNMHATGNTDGCGWGRIIVIQEY